MTSYDLDTLYQLKRKMYLGIIPLVAIAFFLVWMSHTLSNPIDKWALPCLILLLLIDFMVVYKFVRLMPLFEFLTLGFFSLYHLTKFFIYVQVDHNPDYYMLWSPLFYVFVFIALHNRKGFIYSLTIYLITVTFCFFDQNGYHNYDWLNQLYISNISFIVVLYFFQKLFSSYTESVLLKNIAYKDFLTNIGNRRMLDMKIREEITQFKEKGSVFSLILFDIDCFKNINDTFGHDIGDSVLKEITGIVKNNIRSDDYFGRWGGEEFLIIVKNQDAKQTEQLADRLRSMIEKNDFTCVGKVTSSFGITSFNENDTLQTILKRLDSGVYSAKENGRNKVVAM